MGDRAGLVGLLNDDRVDLILADTGCGHGPLYDLFDVLDRRAETADLPMVLLSEPGGQDMLAEATTRRFNAVLLNKPVGQKQLGAAVDAGLRFRARHRQVRDLLRQLEASNDRLAAANAELERRRDESVEEARRKTRFLAAISHDIRTPVNALVLTCQLLEMISQGELEFTETEFPLADFLAKSVESLRPLAEQKSLVLRAEVETPGAVVRTDRVKLGRVVQNLVSNAIKFTEAGEVRVVASAATARGLALTVSDTGVGIPESMREGIFDEFAQLRNPERDRTKGTGLGLAICRRLVTAMGGEIRVVAGPPGARGSTFLVELPPARVVADGPPEKAGSAERPEPAVSGFGGRVLLVEDHEPSRLVMRRVLQRLGLSVDVAVNGRDALGHLEQTLPDLVLLDLMMPEMGGLEALQTIRRRPEWADLPVVILTGDVNERQDEGLAEAGASAFLSKPLDLPQLTSLLARLIPAEGAGRGNRAF